MIPVVIVDSDLQYVVHIAHIPKMLTNSLEHFGSIQGGFQFYLQGETAIPIGIQSLAFSWSSEGE